MSRNKAVSERDDLALTGHLFSLNSEPYTFIIAMSMDLDAYRFPPPFDKSEWNYVQPIKLTNEGLRKYAYKPIDILLAVATHGYYWVPSQVYRDILGGR